MKKLLLFLVIFLIGVITAYNILNQPKEKKLPVINPVDLKKELVDPSLLLERKGYGHTIGDFSFVNQNGDTITHEEIQNKVFVAEYFFTTCSSICPIMNKQMRRIDSVYGRNEDFKILSFTVHPEVDTVEQLKRYAEKHHAGPNWHFLTGNKSDLYSLARKSFFVLKPAEAENIGDAGSDFIHTNNFVLVDKKRRIRGYYDGTRSSSIDSLITDIQLLLREE